jgi:hypothetical protein
MIINAVASDYNRRDRLGLLVLGDTQPANPGTAQAML